MSKEVAVRKLMQECEKDPDLFAKLVAKPQEVAKDHGVTLEPEELAQLQRVQKLKDLVEEFKAGRGIGHPVGYPIDVAWKTTLSNHILSYRPIFYPIFYPIYYPVFYRPIGYLVGGYPVEQAAARPFTGLRKSGKKR